MQPASDSRPMVDAGNSGRAFDGLDDVAFGNEAALPVGDAERTRMSDAVAVCRASEAEHAGKQSAVAKPIVRKLAS